MGCAASPRRSNPLRDLRGCSACDPSKRPASAASTPMRYARSTESCMVQIRTVKGAANVRTRPTVLYARRLLPHAMNRCQDISGNFQGEKNRMSHDSVHVIHSTSPIRKRILRTTVNRFGAREHWRFLVGNAVKNGDRRPLRSNHSRRKRFRCASRPRSPEVPGRENPRRRR